MRGSKGEGESESDAYLESDVNWQPLLKVAVATSGGCYQVVVRDEEENRINLRGYPTPS